ncbi:hypothetical protein D3C87_1641090 [compost metagenome]
MNSVIIAGIIMLLSGFALRVIISKNRFDRRSLTGLQQFGSYWKALIVTIVEWLFGLATYLLIAGGVLLLLVEWYNGHH